MLIANPKGAATVTQRLKAIGDYPFRRLAALLADHAAPADLAPIALSVGEPQVGLPDWIGPIVAEQLAGFGKYPPLAGAPALRAAAAGWLRRRFGLSEALTDPDKMVLPTSGSREALFLAALALVEATPGAAKPLIGMPNPFYQVYAGAALAAGAEPLYLTADRDTGFLPDLTAISAADWARLRMLFLCAPTNPQGAVADLAYVTQALRLCRTHGVILALDECYADIYRGETAPPPSGLQAAAALGEGASGLLTFHSLSKRSSAPGLRSGFIAGDPALVAEVAKLLDYGGGGLPLPLQSVATALWSDDAHVAAIRAHYDANFVLAERHLGPLCGFKAPAGGFFLWLDVGCGEEACRALWTKAALRTLPGRYLARDAADGSNPGARYLRVAIAHPTATTQEALTRLADGLAPFFPQS